MAVIDLTKRARHLIPQKLAHVARLVNYQRYHPQLRHCKYIDLVEASGLTIAAALNVWGRDVLDRPITLDLTRDALRLGVHVWVLVGLVEDVLLVANSRVVDIAVTRDCGSEGQSSSDVLHFG